MVLIVASVVDGYIHAIEQEEYNIVRDFGQRKLNVPIRVSVQKSAKFWKNVWIYVKFWRLKEGLSVDEEVGLFYNN